MTPPRPQQDALIGLPNKDLIVRYSTGVENFDRRVFELSEEQLDTAFLPEAAIGRWPVRVLLAHMVDAELVFIHRMRRTVAEDNPLLAVFDEHAFVDADLYRGPGSGGPKGSGAGPSVISRSRAMAIGGHVAVIHTLRKWGTEWLECLASWEWEREALHPERGPMTVRRICEYATWHVEHHAWYLNRKVERFLGVAKER